MKAILALLCALSLASGVASAQQSAPVKEKKPPVNACEKCQRDAIRELQQCEQIAKNHDQRKMCLNGFDGTTEACKQGACKDQK